MSPQGVVITLEDLYVPPRKSDANGVAKMSVLFAKTKYQFVGFLSHLMFLVPLPPPLPHEIVNPMP
jgi:hypothetical protein